MNVIRTNTIWLALLVSAHSWAGELKILRATYGAGSVERDVTSIVQEHVKNGQLSIRAQSNVLGGDPIFGKVKTLTINYSSNKREFTIHVKEGQTVSLPPEAGSSNDSSQPTSVIGSKPQPSSVANPQLVEKAAPPFKGFTNIKVLQVSPAGVKIMHDKGITAISYEQMSPELREYFNLDNAGYQQHATQQMEAAEQARAISELDKKSIKLEGTVFQVARAEGGILLRDAKVLVGRRQVAEANATGHNVLGTSNRMNPRNKPVPEAVIVYRWEDEWESVGGLVFVNCPTGSYEERGNFSAKVWRIGTFKYTSLGKQVREVPLYTTSALEALHALGP